MKLLKTLKIPMETNACQMNMMMSAEDEASLGLGGD